MRGFSDEKRGYLHYRHDWRFRARFWLLASLICLLGTLLVLALKYPLDKPPPFLYGPYEKMMPRDIEKMEKEFLEYGARERDRLLREQRQKELTRK